MIIRKDVFHFLKKLKTNNDRDWFNDNKSNFKLIEKEIKLFGEELKNRFNEHDEIDLFKLFRIYRDIRFSKDKTPFKTHFGLTWHRTKPMNRGGYYFHIEPNNSFLACGFWDPNPKDLYRIRREIFFDSSELKKIILKNEFLHVWGKLKGNELKTAPRNFDKSHPDISLIRKKQYIFSIKYSDQEVLNDTFIEKLNIAIKTVRPFVDYMSEILTTNENGESII
tara:strand:- start:359 stop:1027 length:669 start_codon:yes stop_codon:yes gene_type:complete